MRKAQAALEFLSTYGFAFLIILVMIGALSYFGLLNPSKFLPNKCSFSPELKCQEAQITANGSRMNLSIIVLNQLGDPITLQQCYISTQYGTSGNCTNASGNAVGAIAGGAQAVVKFNWTSGNFPGSGQKVKATLDANYTIPGKSYPVAIHGEILQAIS